MSKTKTRILNLGLILLIGGLGGVLADQILLPNLASVPLLAKIGFIEQAGNGTTIINPTERIVVTENTALEEVISQVSPRLVAIQTYQGSKLLSQATGFIVTSDGLIITAADLISARANQFLVFHNEQSWSAQLIKKDNDLALLKVEQTNLPVVSLIDLEDLRLGERVILIGTELKDQQLNYFVNLGIIRSIESDVLKLNLTEENILAKGSPLINVKGEVIGLNLIDQRGLLKTIPANKIKKMIEL
jgi:S1-C subfamily serine protease